jgi:hypothetical protein
MKRRYRYILNVLSFGLLIFALYLNFIKKDSVDVSAAPDKKENPVSSLKGETKTSAVYHAAQTFGLR